MTKQIKLPDTTYYKLKREADKHVRTIGGQIEYLLPETAHEVPDTLEKSLREFPVILHDGNENEVEVRLEEIVEIDDILRIIESHNIYKFDSESDAAKNGRAYGSAIV